MKAGLLAFISQFLIPAAVVELLSDNAQIVLLAAIVFFGCAFCAYTLGHFRLLISSVILSSLILLSSYLLPDDSSIFVFLLPVLVFVLLMGVAIAWFFDRLALPSFVLAGSVQSVATILKMFLVDTSQMDNPPSFFFVLVFGIITYWVMILVTAFFARNIIRGQTQYR